MDLSVNSVKQNKILNFKGVKGDIDSKNMQIFRFSTPAYKTSETPYLELTFLDRKVNDKGIVDSNDFVPSETIKIPFENNNTIDISQELFEKYGVEAFAYRYIFTDEEGNEIRTAIDPFKRIKINGDEKNIIEIGNNYGITPQGGTMYHAFIDSVGYNPKLLDENMKKFIRTHANRLGGSIAGLTYLLKHGYFDSYKYIISTPDIGADLTSPHGYWPNNQYQCKNMQDFKDFNFELFKRGKGYVADGAFTSQSLQSPLVQHVLKWGEQSPFYYMLKVEDKIQLGIIPENDEAIKNVGIRLINSPLLKDYNGNRPTYIQFVDDRLLDDTQRQDTKKPVEKYGKFNPDDHYDSVGYQDTVHPFYFEVDSNNFDKKLKCFKNKNYIMLKDLNQEEQEVLFGFRGGDVTSRYMASNATYWDGNVDIIKMNLSNPDMSNEKEVEGFKAAREYLFGVATFWTETIQTDLIKRTAQLNERQKAQIAKANGISDDIYAQIKENATNGDFISNVQKQSKQILQYIKEFPLQSIETSPELSAVFSEPEFQKELLEGDIIDNIYKYTDNIIDKAIPEAYKNNSEYKNYVIKTYTNEILKSIFAQAILENSVDNNGHVAVDRLKDEATLKSMLNHKPTTAEDERAQVVRKLRKNLLKIDNRAIENKIKKELANVSIKDFRMAELLVSQSKSGLNWRFDAAKDIGDLNATQERLVNFEDIWSGNAQADGVKQFWSEFVSRIKKYNPASYIIAEITTMGDYYGWNEFDSMMSYDKKLANTFLRKLANNIIEQEPDSEYAKHAKIFADTSQPYEKRKDAFDAVNYPFKANDDAIGNRFKVWEYENNLPWSLEQNFLEQIGATTSSNYDKYFNRITYFVGVDPEDGGTGVKDGNAGHLKYLKTNTEHFLEYSQPNTAMLSHVFTDNHDKPRAMHALPLDMEIAITGLNINVKGRGHSSLADFSEDDPRIQKIKEITQRNDLANINPFAAAVGLMMSEKIEKSSFSDEEKAKLKLSLKSLVNGEKNGIPDARRARAFGFLPYEITIADLFKNADINDENKIEEFTKYVMEEPMYLQEKIWQLTNALIGVPTLYYGTEYAQSGYETFSKNDFVGNRNRALHERKSDGIYAKYYNKINAISGMANNPKLSALRNGVPVSLEIQEDKDFEMYPIYRKDEKNSQTISVITNFGIKQNTFSKDQGYKFGQKLKPKEVSAIQIQDKNGMCPLADGTVLKRVVYSATSKKFVNESYNYIVAKGAIKRADGNPIEIDDTVVTFYVDTPDKAKFAPAYNGAH